MSFIHIAGFFFFIFHIFKCFISFYGKAMEDVTSLFAVEIVTEQVVWSFFVRVRVKRNLYHDQNLILEIMISVNIAIT